MLTFCCRYASPAMINTASSSSSSGSAGGAGGPIGKPPAGQQAGGASTSPAGSAPPGSAPGCAPARGTHRGTHQLLQQLQSLPGLKNFLRRSSSVSPSPQREPQDVPLSVVFPELFGLAAPSGAATGSEEAGAGGTGRSEGGAVVEANSSTPSRHGAAPARQQQLRFYADDLPYGRVADALPPPAVKPRPRPRGPARRNARGYARGRSLYDEEQEDEDQEEEEEEEDDHVHANDDDEENIYAEICECPRGVVVSGARVILTTACSEERRGYFTFASATSKDQYYTGGSDGTFSGTMSSSNPSNPEEDIYDNVC